MKKILSVLGILCALGFAGASYNMCSMQSISYPMVQGKYLLFLSHQGEEIMIPKDQFAYALDNQEWSDTKCCVVYHWTKVQKQENPQEPTKITCKHRPRELLMVLDPDGERTVLPKASTGYTPTEQPAPEKKDK